MTHSALPAPPAPSPLVPPGAITGRPAPRYHDGTLKRTAVTDGVRREVALRHGAIPGETTAAECVYCGAAGTIVWTRLASGKPSRRPKFVGLSLDHVFPYSLGGANTADNITLACRRCNSSKATRSLSEWQVGA